MDFPSKKDHLTKFKGLYPCPYISEIIIFKGVLVFISSVGKSN